MSDKPIEYLINVGDGIQFFDSSEYWMASSDFRWARSGDGCSKLQQCWRSSKGNIRWEDVPSVEVDSE